MATNFLLQSPELAVAVIAHFMRRLADEDFFDAAIRSGASPELLDVLRSQARLDETLRAFTHPGAIAVAIDETRALRDLRRTMRATGVVTCLPRSLPRAMPAGSTITSSPALSGLPRLPSDLS